MFAVEWRSGRRTHSSGAIGSALGSRIVGHTSRSLLVLHPFATKSVIKIDNRLEKRQL